MLSLPAASAAALHCVVPMWLCRFRHSWFLPVVQSQKSQLRTQLDAASKARESARTSMKELRGTLKFTKGTQKCWLSTAAQTFPPAVGSAGRAGRQAAIQLWWVLLGRHPNALALWVLL